MPKDLEQRELLKKEIQEIALGWIPDCGRLKLLDKVVDYVQSLLIDRELKVAQKVRWMDSDTADGYIAQLQKERELL